MLNKEQIEKIILNSLETINEERDDGEKLRFNSNSKLFGVGCPIDSLSLVSLIVDVEAEINQIVENPISLMDDKAVMRKKSPFESVSNLTEYIRELTENESNG